jgi:hypothetical protein
LPAPHGSQEGFGIELLDFCRQGPLPRFSDTAQEFPSGCGLGQVHGRPRPARESPSPPRDAQIHLTDRATSAVRNCTPGQLSERPARTDSPARGTICRPSVSQVAMKACS